MFVSIGDLGGQDPTILIHTKVQFLPTFAPPFPMLLGGFLACDSPWPQIFKPVLSTIKFKGPSDKPLANLRIFAVRFRRDTVV
jgi:hypothetical protein